MQNETLKKLLKNGAIWGFILFELVFFEVAGQYLVALRQRLHGSRQHAAAAQAVGAHRHHRGRHDDGHDQRQHRPESVGATYALAAIVMLDSMTWPFLAGAGRLGDPAGLALALFTGWLLGAINGLIVWKTGVDAFIVTLGAMLGYRGLVFMYNGEQPTSHLNWTLVDFAEAQFLGLQTAAWFLLAVVLIVWFLMNRTVHGRNAYAIGDNREAAVNAGIRVGPHMMINFMLIGFLAALSAVVFYSGSGSVNPNDGELFELWAITAVVLGGTKLTGGSGSIIHASAASSRSSFCARAWAISARRHRNGQPRHRPDPDRGAVPRPPAQHQGQGGVEGMTDSEPALRLEGIVKTFPGVRALDGVSLASCRARCTP
jgi:ribose transport system permease protein